MIDSSSQAFGVSRVSSSEPVALIQIQRDLSLSETDFLKKAFPAISEAATRMLFVSQTSMGQTLSVAFPSDGLDRARRVVADALSKEVQDGQLSILCTGPEFTVLSVLGAEMRHRPGVAGKVFQTLGRNGVNIVAIAQDSSERDISFVIRISDREKAVQALEEAFQLSDRTHIHLFLCGVGQVGSKLIEQIASHQESRRGENIVFKLCGLCNSKNMHFSKSGIEFEAAKEMLKRNADPSSPRAFVERMKSMNLPNSIFVDCTANEEVPKLYETILNWSISVVTPNKRGNAASYDQYKKISDAARRANVKFFYETNVGAGLPIIGTLGDLLASGDEILKIEAVLSGTISFIFNSFRTGIDFSEVVREAKAKGYTEPDPRDDLSGKDFARKLLILAREIGLPMNEQEVEVESLIPSDCAQAKSVDDFFEKLKGHDGEFAKMAESAEAQGNVIRYIGSISGNQAKVSLQQVDANHPFASLSGSDNIISFTTKRYFDRPLVVKGPGAGVEVTAAGVLADIIRAASYMH